MYIVCLSVLKCTRNEIHGITDGFICRLYVRIKTKQFISNTIGGARGVPLNGISEENDRSDPFRLSSYVSPLVRSNKQKS